MDNSSNWNKAIFSIIFNPSHQQQVDSNDESNVLSKCLQITRELLESSLL